MLDILTVEHGKTRCEAARVILPGFESFELYATPFYNAESQEFEEDKWVITEAQTGTRLGPDLSYETIELAVECTKAWFVVRKVTAAILQQAIERWKEANNAS